MNHYLLYKENEHSITVFIYMIEDTFGATVSSVCFLRQTFAVVQCFTLCLYYCSSLYPDRSIGSYLSFFSFIVGTLLSLYRKLVI